MNITAAPMGFNAIKSVTDPETKTEDILFGSIDYKIYDVANITAYQHYPKFNRTTNAPIVATNEIDKRLSLTYTGSLDN